MNTTLVSRHVNTSLWATKILILNLFDCTKIQYRTPYDPILSTEYPNPPTNCTKAYLTCYVFTLLFVVVHIVFLIADCLGYMTQILPVRFDWSVRKPNYKRKTLLVVGGSQTQVYADSIVIAAHHYTTMLILLLVPQQNNHCVYGFVL